MVFSIAILALIIRYVAIRIHNKCSFLSYKARRKEVSKNLMNCVVLNSSETLLMGVKPVQ